MLIICDEMIDTLAPAGCWPALAVRAVAPRLQLPPKRCLGPHSLLHVAISDRPFITTSSTKEANERRSSSLNSKEAGLRRTPPS